MKEPEVKWLFCSASNSGAYAFAALDDQVKIS